MFINNFLAALAGKGRGLMRRDIGSGF